MLRIPVVYEHVFRVYFDRTSPSSTRLAGKRRKPGKPQPHGRKPGGQKPTPPPAGGVRARRRQGEDAWELVLPRCARDRQEDLEEVRKMLDAGEVDVARDECLWLLQGCTDCLEAHRILGEIALEENDLPLARGHFGYAFRLGTKAIEQAGGAAPLPYRLPANQAFLEASKALAWCLNRLEKPDLAAEVIDLMLRCDPEDTLAVRNLLAERPSS